MAEGDDFYYELDEHNRLLSVSASWCQFAADNNAPALADPETIKGQIIWAFINGEEARQVYGLIFGKVRTSGSPVQVPFRCDSPTRRRFMKLEVKPLPDLGLGLSSWIEREEERAHVSLLDPAVARSDELLAICAWCKRIEVEGEWLEVEDGVERLGLFDSVQLPRLSHRICPPCEKPWLDFDS